MPLDKRGLRLGGRLWLTCRLCLGHLRFRLLRWLGGRAGLGRLREIALGESLLIVRTQIATVLLQDSLQLGRSQLSIGTLVVPIGVFLAQEGAERAYSNV